MSSISIRFFPLGLPRLAHFFSLGLFLNFIAFFVLPRQFLVSKSLACLFVFLHYIVFKVLSQVRSLAPPRLSLAPRTCDSFCIIAPVPMKVKRFFETFLKKSASFFAGLNIVVDGRACLLSVGLGDALCGLPRRMLFREIVSFPLRMPCSRRHRCPRPARRTAVRLLHAYSF